MWTYEKTGILPRPLLDYTCSVSKATFLSLWLETSAASNKARMKRIWEKSPCKCLGKEHEIVMDFPLFDLPRRELDTFLLEVSIVPAARKMSDIRIGYSISFDNDDFRKEEMDERKIEHRE